MLFVYKKLIATALLLLVIPVIALLIGWYWTPHIFNYDLHFLFWITVTASLPFAIVTCFIFLLLFILGLSPKSKTRIIALAVLLAFSVFLGQGIKSVAKSTIGKSRPFVVWLESTYDIDDSHFYSLPRKQRAQILTKEIEHDETIPHWVLSHWKQETGYSLPSGHTLFATCWLMLFIGLLPVGRHKVMISVITIWTVLILVSRLLLGMHWPVDLIGGIFVALLVSSVTCYCANKLGLISDNRS